MWTLGRICVRSPLPSLVTMIDVPVSAIEEIRAGDADVGGEEFVAQDAARLG